MATERSAQIVQIDRLQEASSKFYLKEEDYGDIVEESSVLKLEGYPVGVKCEFAHIGFGSSAWNNDLVGIRTIKNVLMEKGPQKDRIFVASNQDLVLNLSELPLRIVDQGSRKQLLITADTNNNDEDSLVGVTPKAPPPELSTSVALEIPK